MKANEFDDIRTGSSGRKYFWQVQICPWYLDMEFKAKTGVPLLSATPQNLWKKFCRISPPALMFNL